MDWLFSAINSIRSAVSLAASSVGPAFRSINVVFCSYGLAFTSIGIVFGSIGLAYTFIGPIVFFVVFSIAAFSIFFVVYVSNLIQYHDMNISYVVYENGDNTPQHAEVVPVKSENTIKQLRIEMMEEERAIPWKIFPLNTLQKRYGLVFLPSRFTSHLSPFGRLLL
jgi:hypothetical protein